jgi:hydroxymethylpyrimidine/phosphomethylpyrimidine kinase
MDDPNQNRRITPSIVEMSTEPNVILGAIRTGIMHDPKQHANPFSPYIPIHMTHIVLSIAGFDGSGGAGMQADLKTFSAFGCYGMTVLTALPVQNTTGVKGLYRLPTQAIQDQLEVLFEDVLPDAIKIGMLFNAEIIQVVADFLRQHAATIPMVLDPVMYAKSGDALLLPEAVATLKTELIPLTTLITPNLPEAAALIGSAIDTQEDMLPAMQQLHTLGAQAVLLKGGHAVGDMACDLYAERKDEGETHWLEAPRIVTQNTHGTGCTLSAAIAACLSKKMPLLESCMCAKNYLTNALEGGRTLKMGKGNGPVDHFYHLKSSTT